MDNLTKQNRLIIFGLVFSTLLIMLIAVFSVVNIQKKLNEGYQNFGQVISRTLAIESNEITAGLSKKDVYETIKSHTDSILKSHNGNPDGCDRFTYHYENPPAGEGYFIHTYMGDGNPLPSYEGDPTPVDVLDDIDAYTDMIWNSLNEDNKVSLFVRYIDIATGKYETKIVNKNH